MACDSVPGFFSNGTMVYLFLGNTSNPSLEMLLNVPMVNLGASESSPFELLSPAPPFPPDATLALAAAKESFKWPSRMVALE